MSALWLSLGGAGGFLLAWGWGYLYGKSQQAEAIGALGFRIEVLENELRQKTADLEALANPVDFDTALGILRDASGDDAA